MLKCTRKKKRGKLNYNKEEADAQSSAGNMFQAELSRQHAQSVKPSYRFPSSHDIFVQPHACFALIEEHLISSFVSIREVRRNRRSMSSFSCMCTNASTGNRGYSASVHQGRSEPNATHARARGAPRASTTASITGRVRLVRRFLLLWHGL